MVISVIGGVSGPQTSKPVAVARTLCAFNDFFIRQIAGTLIRHSAMKLLTRTALRLGPLRPSGDYKLRTFSKDFMLISFGVASSNIVTLSFRTAQELHTKKIAIKIDASESGGKCMH
jgi:hypothetical protein